MLYGDSLFETLAVKNGQPLLLKTHLQRLAQSAARLGIECDIEALKNDIKTVCKGLTDNQVIRLTLTRGTGSRGYQPTGEESGSRIVSLHPWPDYSPSQRTHGVRLGLSDVRLARQPFLAGIKHGNRLEQVLAAATIPSSCDDVVMLDSADNVISTSKANLFVQQDGQWYTPELSHSGVHGLIRQIICAKVKQHGETIVTKPLTLTDLEQAQALFICNCLMGIWPVRRFLDAEYPASVTACQPILSYLLTKQCCL